VDVPQGGMIKSRKKGSAARTARPDDMQDNSPFRRAAILGIGLIGGSFALALRRQFPKTSVIGFDRADQLRRARSSGLVTETATDIAAAVRGANLVYIALPIGVAIDVLPAVARSAEPNALVTDACSTKAVICRRAQEHFSGAAHFLGGHPMAGKETSGVEHADADLFRSARYALIGSENELDPRVQEFLVLLRGMGAEPIWCDAETHDWAVGIVSHLPQLLSVALARVVESEMDETGMPMALGGPGLHDMLRLAGSSYEVWRDICLTNTDNISRGLERLSQAIEHLRTRLTSKELDEEFQIANELYKLLHKTV
jgi:prephenate dehydrogenase